MEINDFNSSNFTGFQQGEDILVDSSILLALISIHDPWHDTVLKLFNEHIFTDESLVLLYANPLIVNEVLHLSTKSLEKFTEQFKISFTKEQYEDLQEFTENMLSVLIEEGIILILDGDINSVRQQIKLAKTLGAADAGNVSIANLYGTNFITLDNKLVNNIRTAAAEITNIQKVYFTSPIHRTY